MIDNVFRFVGHVKITNPDTGEVLLDKKNSIHPQNMSRIIARGLANEPNSNFFRLAYGQGGNFLDTNGYIHLNPPRAGGNAGWESRLYREVFSEIVDDNSSFFAQDIGSAGTDNIRINGGANAGRDIGEQGVRSQEINRTSNVVIRSMINEYEPLNEERDFYFNELGIYSSGAPGADTKGRSSIFPGSIQKNSKTPIYEELPGSTNFSIVVEVDGVRRESLIVTPPSGTGSGPGGLFTYGDLCEGINTASWLASTSPFDFSNSLTGAFFFINDAGDGTYPSINGINSRHFITVESKTTGKESSISFPSDETALGFPNLIYFLALENWLYTKFNTSDGQDTGVLNNTINPDRERERLLTHLTFDDIKKINNSRIQIEYTIQIIVGDECVFAEEQVTRKIIQ